MEENSDWFFRWRICERACDIVPPELHAESSYGGIGDEVGYSRKLDVESSNGEVGISGGGRYEGLKGKRRRIELPAGNQICEVQLETQIRTEED